MIVKKISRSFGALRNQGSALFFGIGAGFFAFAAQAQESADANLAFSGSGFLTLSAGKMLDGSHGVVQGYACPCFTSDYSQAGIYDGRGGLQMAPDSKLGLQGKVAVKDSGLSLTSQAVVRATPVANVDLQWAYASYELSGTTTLQVGRKRLPLFYYSDVQDIGFALPWSHLPQQLYGWEVVNYNGVNLLHSHNWGAWAVTTELLAGYENLKDSGYWKIYNGKQSRTDVKWGNILGGDVMLGNGAFETRLVYIQSNTERQIISGATSTDPYLNGQLTDQRMYGATFSFDREQWLVRAELLRIDHPGAQFRDNAQQLTLGHRFGDWQLTGTVARYYADAVNGGDPQGQEAHINRVLTARYDLTPTSDVKLQLDAQDDQSGPNYMTTNFGNARLLTLAYDKVF